jgi:Transcription factor WhiB
VLDVSITPDDVDAAVEAFADLWRAVQSARPSWQRRAARRGDDTRAFFPARSELLDHARAVRAGCAVRDDCYADAMENRWWLSGVWGGLSAIQRKRMTKTDVA